MRKKAIRVLVPIALAERYTEIFCLNDKLSRKLRFQMIYEMRTLKGDDCKKLYKRLSALPMERITVYMHKSETFNFKRDCLKKEMKYAHAMVALMYNQILLNNPEYQAIKPNCIGTGIYGVLYDPVEYNKGDYFLDSDYGKIITNGEVWCDENMVPLFPIKK